MSFNIQNNTIQTQNYSANTATASASASGNLMGQQVTMSNSPMSLLADCAEELTFAVDTTDEFEMKERKEKESSDIKNSELYELYRKVNESNDKGDQGQNIKNTILNMQGSKNADAFAKLARDLTNDSAQAYHSLQDAYESLKKENADPNLLKSIEEAIQKLEVEDKSKIIACMHAEVTANTDVKFSSLGDNTNFYSQCTQEFTNLKDVYNLICNKYPENIDTALDFLYKALDSDLKSNTQSLEKTKLTSINASFGELRSFQSAHSLCTNFITRIETVHNITSFNKDGLQFMGTFLDLKSQNYLGASHIEALAREAKPENPEQEVFFLQEMLATVKQFSVNLFENSQERMKLVDAVQEAVDNAVQKEDEWLANME